MRGVTLRDGRDIANCRDTTNYIVRLLILWCLRDRVDSIHISQEGESAELLFRRDDQFEEGVPPPPHMIGELIRVLAGLRPARERWAGWWRRKHRTAVPQAFEGACPLVVGSAAGSLVFSVLPHSGGVFMALQPDCGPAGQEQAMAVLAAYHRHIRGLAQTPNRAPRQIPPHDGCTGVKSPERREPLTSIIRPHKADVFKFLSSFRFFKVKPAAIVPAAGHRQRPAHSAIRTGCTASASRRRVRGGQFGCFRWFAGDDSVINGVAG